eukprot:3495285-Rhodomonas_salina.1
MWLSIKLTVLFACLQFIHGQPQMTNTTTSTAISSAVTIASTTGPGSHQTTPVPTQHVPVDYYVAGAEWIQTQTCSLGSELSLDFPVFQFKPPVPTTAVPPVPTTSTPPQT